LPAPKKARGEKKPSTEVEGFKLKLLA